MDSYDVAVVGGGLIGCATATYLAEGGASVALFEQGQINRGASGRNAGSLHFQLEHRLIKHADSLEDELGYYVALALLAIEHWQALPGEFDEDIGLAMHGGLMLAETAEEIELLARKERIESAQGLKVRLLDAGEIRKLAPYLADTVQAALLCPKEGHCNPRLVTTAYANRAMRNGAQLFPLTPVKSLRRREGHWELELEPAKPGAATAARAKTLVNAAGAWCADIGQMADVHLPMFPVCLTITVTEKLPPILHHLIQHVGKQLSMKQVEDGNVLIGGGALGRLRESQSHWDRSVDGDIDPGTLRANIATALSVAPGFREVHALRSWTGTTGNTADQLPIVGEVPHAPGFFVAAGGSGYTYGPTYARLLAELILEGRSSFPVAPYSPSRFNRLDRSMGAS